MDIELWIVAGATVLSLFFGLAAFTLSSFSWSKLGDTLAGTKRGKRRLDTLDKHLKPLQMTLALCKTITNFVLIAAMVCLISDKTDFPTWQQAVIAIAICSVIMAVFGVAIPFAWANYAGEKTLAVILPVLVMLRFLLWPLVAFMSLFDLPIRRLSGVHDGQEEPEGEAKAEILQAAAEGAAEGAVDADEVEMIESVMEFADTRAAEIMTPRTDMFALSADTPWEEAVRTIHQAGHTRVPIFEDNLDNIVGIIYAKDLLKFMGHQPPSDLKSICRKPYFVPDSKCLDNLLKDFKTRKVHIAVVLDEYGGTAGLVTIEDVLEEIVGEISDEYDKTQAAQVRQVSDDTLDVDGRLRVDELNDELDIELPEDENYDTVAGFAAAYLGYIPPAGEKFVAFGAEFTVLQADERKISQLRVRRINSAGDDDE